MRYDDSLGVDDAQKTSDVAQWNDKQAIAIRSFGYICQEGAKAVMPKRAIATLSMHVHGSFPDRIDLCRTLL